MNPIIINKINNLEEGDCILLPKFKVFVDNKKYHAYMCIGETFDEAIDYFMSHWGNIPKHKPIHSIELVYNLIKKQDLDQLSLSC